MSTDLTFTHTGMYYFGQRTLLRLEALLWMMRPITLLTSFIAVPGWLAAESPPSCGRLAALVGSVALGRAIANITNDILDEEKDHVTAPRLPLPSGLVSVSQAALMAGLLTISLFVLLRIAAETWGQFFMGLGGVTFGAVIYGSYSFLKPYALLVMAVTGVVYMSAPLTAWVVAGGDWTIEIVVALAYGLFRGLAANVFSTLRDVDRDAKVGNYSISVRLGPSRALAFGTSIEALAALCILPIATVQDRVLLGIVVTTVSVALLGFSYLVTARRQRSASGRGDRTILIWPVTVARNYAGIALVQSVPVGIAVGSVTLIVLGSCMPLYQLRIVDGGLRDALRRNGPTTADLSS